MNARTKPAPPYTAQQLADMPHGESRLALIAQECAYMQENHGRRLFNEIKECLEGEMPVARVACIGLEGRRFVWEAFPECELCAGAGQLAAPVTGKLFDCSACKDDATEYLYTDYDGNLLKGRA